MAGITELETLNESDSSPGMRMGRVRWTICAMLFAATTINYMDRQVLAILKPTLAHTIGMTEVNYGNIVGLFTLAYTIGILAAGRFVDKVGTRIGYMVIMAVWSLSAMGHALANSVLEFGIARFCLGLGESGNFPRSHQDHGRVVPTERALAGHRHLQLRSQYWRNASLPDCACGYNPLRVALRFPGYRRLQCPVDSAMVL